MLISFSVIPHDFPHCCYYILHIRITPGWRGSVLGNITESLQKLKANKLEAFLFHNAEYIFDEVAVNALTSVCVEKLAERAGVSIYTQVFLQLCFVVNSKYHIINTWMSYHISNCHPQW